jgi:DNA primase
VSPQDLTMTTVPARFAELGDLHAGIDDAVFSLDPLLEWADRDEREGAPDPGEPQGPDPR